MKKIEIKIKAIFTNLDILALFLYYLVLLLFWNFWLWINIERFILPFGDL